MTRHVIHWLGHVGWSWQGFHNGPWPWWRWWGTRVYTSFISPALSIRTGRGGWGYESFDVGPIAFHWRRWA